MEDLINEYNSKNYAGMLELKKVESEGYTIELPQRHPL